MNAAILPRPIDHVRLANHREVWPSVPDEQRFSICPHCGHYGFERDVNYDECFVKGCECFSSNPHRDEDICVEHMISLWSGNLCQSLGTSHDADREKWFTRHCQDEAFLTITVKRKYAQAACAFYDALKDEGRIEFIDLADSSIAVAASEVVITENFTLASTLSIRFHLKSTYINVAEDYSYALADSAKVACIHLPFNQADVSQATLSAPTSCNHEAEDLDDSACPF